MHEFDIINKYFSKLSKKNLSSLNLNDDVYFNKSQKLVISIDTYVQGKHFLNFKSPDLVIKKILRSSISDLICKGVYPKHYFISASGNKKNFTKLNLFKVSKSLKEEQKKYNIFLSGGDTVNSNKLSFSITTIGNANNIIYRNKAKINDDIYVTGNLGDSYIGLKILQKKLYLNKELVKYFVDKYYKPNLQYALVSRLNKIANTSMDISDGLFSDIEKLINKQKLSYEIDIDKIPISKNLIKLINSLKLKKESLISRGDDYQILFTADKSKNRIIQLIAKKLKIKITKIGTIKKQTDHPNIIVKKGRKITINQKGYFHEF